MTPNPIRWGAILFAAAVCLALQVALFFFGGGAGLSLGLERLDSKLGVGAALFAGVALAVTLFFSGYIAAWMAECRSRSSGALASSMGGLLASRRRVSSRL